MQDSGRGSEDNVKIIRDHGREWEDHVKIAEDNGSNQTTNI